MIKALVCGGRKFTNQFYVDEVLDAFNKKVIEAGETVFIVHGAAPGADTCADVWAKKNSIPFKDYPANWYSNGKYDNRAGILRNIQMLEQEKPNIIIAFKGGTGTKHMCDIATKAGVKVYKAGWE